MNSEDPLGLEANKALINYDAAVAKKCDGHPEANGCRGIGVVAIVKKVAEVAVTVVGTGLAITCTVATEGVCGLAVGSLISYAAIGAGEGLARQAIAGGNNSLRSYLEAAGSGALEVTAEGVGEEYLTPLGDPGAHQLSQNFVQTLTSFWHY